MSRLTKLEVTTEKAPKALGPYSQAIVLGKLVFVSGQLGISPESGELVEGGIIAQTKQAFTNISSILQASGSNLNSIVKVTVFLREMSDFKQMNEVYASFFSDNPPVRTTVAVSGLPKNALCEIDCIAVVV